MTPIHLSDDELTCVMAYAQPIARHLRDAFLREVASEVSRLGDQVGSGTVSRICRQLQRKFFDVPDLNGAA
jgi:hypothetical protein